MRIFARLYICFYMYHPLAGLYMSEGAPTLLSQYRDISLLFVISEADCSGPVERHSRVLHSRSGWSWKLSDKEQSARLR